MKSTNKKAKKVPALPEILMEQSERRLRVILRAIVRANPDKHHRTNEVRVTQAINILLGREPQRGAPGFWRDDMLEMMAFIYSVKRLSADKISIEALARAVIDMPSGVERPVSEDGAIEDLVNKFIAYAPELLEAHSYDGRESFSDFYDPVVDVLRALQQAGIKIDEDVIPMGTRQER